MNLHEMKNSSRPKKRSKLLGRGTGCKHGKTCCRGNKGQGSRSGARARYGYEGGQMRFFRKLPVRGFTRGLFIKPVFSCNLCFIEKQFQEGETVSVETLKQKKLIPASFKGTLKILSRGELTKKVEIQAHGFSKGALKKLEGKISYKVIDK